MRILSICLLFLLLGCSSPKELDYSFFVAGHAYGDPNDRGKTKGLYLPFKEKFDFINDQSKMEFGVLLGDVVWQPKDWPRALEDINLLKMPIHVARGNHDGGLKAFEERFGKSYKSFLLNESLFIILDPNIDQWNISDEQLVFLMNAIRMDGKNAKNIFIFSHQVLWWSYGKYEKPKPNSLQNKAKETNYWSRIEPLLRNLDKPVFLFAGDVGAFSKEHRKADHIIEYSYFNDNNLTYISTGMGGGVRDNFVIVDVFKSGKVNFRLIHLNGDDMNSLGKLEDYRNPN